MSTPPSRIFVVSLDSTREIDLANNQVRRLEGVLPATEREGERRWRKFVAMAPDPPAPGTPLTLIWSADPESGVAKATRTSPIVGAFLEDPTVGPFAWIGDADVTESSPGAVLVDATSIRTTTGLAAHTICALANVGAQAQGFASPEPMFELRGTPRDGWAVTVGGHPIAVGPPDAVQHLFEALRRLPPVIHYAFAAVAASVPGATWDAKPIAGLPESLLREPLRAYGLTDAEIGAQPDRTALARAAAAAEEFLGSPGAAGRWLREAHRSLDTRSPLEVLAERESIAPALSDPYSGGEPAETTWEPEAVACWRAAKAAGWTTLQLGRDRQDGRWTVRGLFERVPVCVADNLYGVVAGAQLEGTAGFVALDGPVRPEQAPVELVRSLKRGRGLVTTSRSPTRSRTAGRRP